MNFSKYQNTLPYPEKPTQPNIEFRRGILTYDQAQEMAEKAQTYASDMKAWEAQMQIYYVKLGEYKAQGKKLYEQFKQDVLIEVGLAGHPKADKVFAKAWERGHSSGYEEVYNVLEDLAELVL